MRKILPENGVKLGSGVWINVVCLSKNASKIEYTSISKFIKYEFICLFFGSNLQMN